MEFKNRTELSRFIHTLEKEGWLTSEWVLKEYMKDDKPMTRGTKMFKINFDKVKKKND